MSFAKGLLASQESLKGSDTTGDSSSGGAGTVPTLTRPDVVIAAPGGITSSTPAHAVASIGSTASFVAGQDLQQLAQANSATVVKDGLVFFTYGMAQNPRKPNTETGIQLHAATGNVNTQSQQGATRLARRTGQ
nr:DUF2345 domain-containing protein [Rubrivivax gelatinosus]